MKEYQVITLYSEELKKEKRIHVYLPENYYQKDEFYRVLYMHDGQNLFDDKQAYMNRSWRIMNLYEENSDLPELIIVGIDSDDDRADELLPIKIDFKDGSRAGGKANMYLDFITKTVKPLIDKKYRTFKSPKNTGIMGSSFGGVNTTYAAIKYNAYFSRFGAVSNAYFYGEMDNYIIDLLSDSQIKRVKKFYMDVGTKESEDKDFMESYIECNNKVYKELSNYLDDTKLRFNIIENAIHHETAWEKRFPEIVKFMFKD